MLNLITAVLIIAYSITFTVISFRFLRKNFDRLYLPRFRRRYGSLYFNVDTVKRSAIYFTFLFLVRRMLFAAVISNAGASLVLQILICDLLSTVLLGFYWSVRPMESTLGNVIEIFNESAVLLSVWSMVLFSDFVQSPVQRYDIGFYFMYFVAAVIAFNLVLFTGAILRKMSSKCRTKFAKGQAQTRIESTNAEKKKDLSEVI